MRSRSTTVAALAAVLLLSTLGCSDGESDAARDVPEYTIEQFMATTAYAGGWFSSDLSRVLVSSDRSGVYNAYTIPVSGGEPTALTTSTEDSTFAVGFFPDDDRILYRADRGGDENDHLYVRELDGAVKDLTPGDGLKASFAGWSGDGETFWVTTNEREPRFFDVYAYATDGYAREMVFRNDEGWGIGGASPDGRYLSLTRSNTTSDVDLYVHDTESGETVPILGPGVEGAVGPADFAHDGSHLLFVSNVEDEFAQLMRYDLASGEISQVIETEWDVVGAGYSWTGEYLTVLVNADARNVYRLYDAATMEPVALSGVPEGDLSALRFSRDDTLLSYYVASGRGPRDLYVQAIDDDAPTRLTSSLNPEIDPDHLVEPEVVRFASYDGVEIPGILYRPKNASPENPVPALVWVHGGPGGQSRVGYYALIQYLVNHDYAVYAINNRGSSGYGKTFYRMDDRKHGEADLGDCVASKRMLIDTGWVDPDRVGIIGGSYGGYMVLAALAFEPEVFDVGVDIFGVSNWLRTLTSIPPYWESIRKALYDEMGDPATDEERLRRISPLFHAENITKPLMVLQGANDPRVIKPESDEIVAAVEANGVPVEYLVFDDEGHGFEKKENRIRAYEGILEFLEMHLRRAGVEGAEGV